MWENLKQGVKKMVAKRNELAECYRKQRDDHIAEVVQMASVIIRSDISKKLRKFDENYMRICTSGDIHVDISAMPGLDDVSVKHHMGMIEDRLRREVPEWIRIIGCKPIDEYTEDIFVVEYIIDEYKVCEE